MKTKPFSLMLWACLLSGGDGVAQTGDPASPELDKAMVTVPYAELKRLMQMGAAHATLSAVDQGKPPPVSAGLMASLFRLDCSGGKAALEAEFRVENFSGEWESIPLMGAGPAVAAIEPTDARVLAKDGQLCLVTKALGAATVKLRFVERDIGAYSASAVVEIDSLASAVSTLEITGLPEGRAASARSGEDVLPGYTKGIFALPAKGGSIGVWLEGSAKMAAEMAPPTPSEWSLQNEIAVRRDDGTLRYTGMGVSVQNLTKRACSRVRQPTPPSGSQTGIESSLASHHHPSDHSSSHGPPNRNVINDPARCDLSVFAH